MEWENNLLAIEVWRFLLLQEFLDRILGNISVGGRESQ